MAPQDEKSSRQGAAMNKQDIKKISVGLVSGDRELQYKLIDEHCTDDITFQYTLFTTHGKEAYKAVYRYATTIMDYRLDFYDIISEEDRVAMYVNLKIKYAPLYIWRFNFPTVVLIYFRKDPRTGKKLICKYVDHHALVDHHSMWTLFWFLGWPWVAITEGVFHPLAGHFFVAAGWLVDTLASAKEQALEQLKSALGVSSVPLPQRLESHPHGRSLDEVYRRIVDLDAVDTDKCGPCGVR